MSDIPIVGIPDEAHLKKMLEERAKRQREQDANDGCRTGGLIMPMSDCCNAIVKRTTEGIIRQVCSTCGKDYQEPVYR